MNVENTLPYYDNAKILQVNMFILQNRSVCYSTKCHSTDCRSAACCSANQLSMSIGGLFFSFNLILFPCQSVKSNNCLDGTNFFYNFFPIYIQAPLLVKWYMALRRHDTQHNDIQPNDIQPNDIQPNDIQTNDIQPNDSQHNDIQHTNK